MDVGGVVDLACIASKRARALCLPSLSLSLSAFVYLRASFRLFLLFSRAFSRSSFFFLIFFFLFSPLLSLIGDIVYLTVTFFPVTACSLFSLSAFLLLSLLCRESSTPKMQRERKRERETQRGNARFAEGKRGRPRRREGAIRIGLLIPETFRPLPCPSAAGRVFHGHFNFRPFLARVSQNRGADLAQTAVVSLL